MFCITKMFISKLVLFLILTQQPSLLLQWCHLMDLETKNDYIQTDMWELKDAEAISGYNRVKNKQTRWRLVSHAS